MRKESLKEAVIIDFICLVLFILIGFGVVIVSSIVYNLPIAVYVQLPIRSWDFEQYVIALIGTMLALILIDKFRKYVE